MFGGEILGLGRREERAEKDLHEIEPKANCSTKKKDLRRCHGEILEPLLSQSNGYARVTTAKQIEVTTNIQN